MKNNKPIETPSEAYKGLFKGFTNNLDVGVGKKIPALSYEHKDHHYSIGYAPW